ncbi:MAG: hypothetical protein R3B51_14430 [Thermodesulfobacteriota bacterium]
MDAGDVDEDGTSEWYAGLSCYVFPSSGEGWSFTPRESLYLGIPTLITDIPVHDELVRSGYYKRLFRRGRWCRRYPTRKIWANGIPSRWVI